MKEFETVHHNERRKKDERVKEISYPYFRIGDFIGHRYFFWAACIGLPEPTD
jgi:hypothetical protein